MSGAALYLASTPMIALESAGAALARGGRAQLVLIEDFDLAEQLAELLQCWSDNPFEAIHRLPGRHTEHMLGAGDNHHGVADFLHRMGVKRALRRQTLAAIRRIDTEFAPDSVWVGNDRKVETQYALHLASQRLADRPGRYLDDGLYSYLGDVRQRPLIRRIDWLVKRLTYGSWWHRGEQAGTSPWIAESWFAFPDQAIDQDLCRRHRELPANWFTGRPFLRLSALAAKQFAVDRDGLRRCESVLVLPHSNQFLANPALAGSLRAFIDAAGARGHRVAIKYHPRESQPDPAALLADSNVLALPMLLPMELLLPLLPFGAVLTGEGSTALLAASWLRPDLKVFDLGWSRGGYAARAAKLFARNGIAKFDADLPGFFRPE